MKLDRWLGIAAVALAGTLALAACGADEPTAVPTQAPAAEPTAAPDSSGEAAWAQVLAGAKQEGIIRILSGSSSVNNMPAFEKAFTEMTGGKVEFTELTAGVIASRLPEEYKAGQRNWDIILLGGSSGISEGLDKAGVLGNLNEFFVLPEITRDETWVGGFGDIWVDQDTKTYKIHHLAELSKGSQWWVNRDVLPESKLSKVEDVFDIPELKGKFCTFDPRQEGAADANFGQVAAMYGPDMVRRIFTDLDVVVTRDFNKLNQDALHGQCLVVVGGRITNLHVEGVGLHIKDMYIFNPGIADEYKGKVEVTCCGAGKQKSTLDGWVGGGSANNMLAVAMEPPHPNAAKVFVNWILSKEGQMAWPQPSRDSTCSRRADLQDWCAQEYRTMGPRAATWEPLEEGKAYVSIHTRANFFIRKVAQQIAIEVFGR